MRSATLCHWRGCRPFGRTSATDTIRCGAFPICTVRGPNIGITISCASSIASMMKRWTNTNPQTVTLPSMLHWHGHFSNFPAGIKSYWANIFSYFTRSNDRRAQAYTKSGDHDHYSLTKLITIPAEMVTYEEITYEPKVKRRKCVTFCSRQCAQSLMFDDFLLID